MGYTTKTDLITVKQLWKIQDEAIALHNQGQSLPDGLTLALISKDEASLIIGQLVKDNKELRNG